MSPNLDKLNKGTFYTLIFFSILSYKYLNWKEDIFLVCVLTWLLIRRLYVSKGKTKNIFFSGFIHSSLNYIPVILLIFLLNQPILNNFYPLTFWWFNTLAGLNSVFIMSLGIFSTIYYFISKEMGGSASVHHRNLFRPVHDLESRKLLIKRSLYYLINGFQTNIIIVLSLFIMVVLNLNELSPQNKIQEDYSVYLILVNSIIICFSERQVLNRSPKLSEI